MNLKNYRPTPLNRRQILCGAAAGAAAIIVPCAHASSAERKAAVNGRIKQSVVFWCFNIAGEKWDLDRTCRVARELGCLSVELAPPQEWGILKKHGLVCAIAPNGM